MDEVKKVPFHWELGEETVSLKLGMYANTGRLHMPFAAMTVNLPAYSLEAGQAFISGDISKDLLRFIRGNKLGKVLPYKVHSGFGTYSVVSFDLNKLKEFDPKGVHEFKKAWNIPDKKLERKKKREIER